MVYTSIKCSNCNSDNVIKHGKTKRGKQRYVCKNPKCPKKSFINDYTNNGCLLEVTSKILDMTLNASGVRDIATVLKISQNTVMAELKKLKILENINSEILGNITSFGDIDVHIVKVEEAELDEMWSYVKKKDNKYCLWHGIDHNTGKILAYTFGDRKDEVFRKLKKMLEPFGIQKFYSDNNTLKTRPKNGSHITLPWIQMVGMR